MSEEAKEKVISVREAGRRGGRTTARRYGHEFYQAIGKKGGGTVAEKYGHEHFEAIGKKGGRKVASLVEAGRQALGVSAPQD